MSEHLNAYCVETFVYGMLYVQHAANSARAGQGIQSVASAKATTQLTIAVCVQPCMDCLQQGSLHERFSVQSERLHFN